jgi:NADH-quinone oxidoreductase subunit N
MLAEILNLRKFIIPIALVALCVIGGLTYCDLNVHFEPFFSDMLRVDNFSTSFSLLLIVIAILLIALSYDFYDYAEGEDFRLHIYHHFYALWCISIGFVF